MKLSLNKKLAGLAFLLSLLAMLISLIFPSSASQKRASIKIEYLSVLDLATEIRNRKPVRLIDLRDDSSFAAFHIPTAEPYSLNNLQNLEINSSIKTTLYSDEVDISEQAFYLLADRGMENLFVLNGGIQDWYDRILYPKMPKTIPDNYEDIATQIKSLSAYFGGHSIYVDEGNPLNYYKGIAESSPSTKTKRLIRMGC
tara:strand:+ start:14203 stop:14799 length:597 start_codon:yes stop_codon:yes gene_type:complete